MPAIRHGSGRKKTSHSAREWWVRGALALGASFLAYVTLTNALANVVVRVDPANAYALNPAEGQIAAAFAEQSFASAPASGSTSQPVRLAIQALDMDPTAVKALTVLGLREQLRSEDVAADRAFGYSMSLSRRELQPQLWAIERAVARGDIDEALKNYDIAMRTSRKARDVLFPILSSAVSEPKVRTSLIPVLAFNPIWAQPFVEYSAINSPEPRAVSALFRGASRKGVAIGDHNKAFLVNNLAARNFMDEAWNYYGSFRPRVERNRSRDPHFQLSERVRTVFDWNMGSVPGLSVAILPANGSGVVDFAVPPSTGATVVSQVQMLPPGIYRLTGKSRGIDQSSRSRPYWSLACRSGQPLGRVEVPNSGEDGGPFAGEFIVPAGCEIQTLSFVVRASDSISGVSGQIENVQLVPVDEER